MTFGLVLGGGGSAGEAFHRGVLRAMSDFGVDARRADVVVGTSAGSIVAASVRRYPGPRPAEPTGVRRRRLLPRRTTSLALLRRPRQALNAVLVAPAFTTGRTSLELLSEEMASKYRDWPESDLYVVAVRRRDGRRVAFGAPGEPRPDVGSAIAASCAIPGYFKPVSIDGVEYVDGGLHSPTNADLLAGRGLDLVVVSSPMSVQPRAVGARVDLGMRLLCRAYLRSEVWALRGDGTRVIIVEPDRAVVRAAGLNPLDVRRIHEIEERSYESARVRLRDLPLELALRSR